MKLNLEQYLYPIDQSFANKKQNEVYAIYLIIAALLFAFSYFLFWDNAEAEYIKTKQAREDVENKLLVDEGYLKQHPESEIARIEEDTRNIDASTLALQDQNAYIKYKISQISELFYNEKAWGSYIDSISENARKFRVKIALITNEKTFENEKFGHVLDVNIMASGHYGDLLKFINALEQSDLVIDLHDLKLSAKQVLVADINSSVWGITY